MDKSKKSMPNEISLSLKDAFQDTFEEDLPEHFQTLIDDNLKKGVEETLKEGIPDRFRDLLAQLDAELGGGEAQ